MVPRLVLHGRFFDTRFQLTTFISRTVILTKNMDTSSQARQHLTLYNIATSHLNDLMYLYHSTANPPPIARPGHDIGPHE